VQKQQQQQHHKQQQQQEKEQQQQQQKPPEAICSVLLSSRAEFKFSTHTGSTGPSNNSQCFRGVEGLV
jgi:hypothetical protein